MARLRWFSLVVVVVALVLGAPRVSPAAPMSTDFATTRSLATTIVLGTVRQKLIGNAVAITVDVDTVLRGTAIPGPLPVLPSPDGSIDVDGKRVVAFIDGTGALRWVGTLVAGPRIEEGVLLLHGFFDFNAHLVRPGIMSLPQLKNLLATGTLDQTFSATLSFPDGHGGMHRSSKHLTVRHDPLANTQTIVGFAPTCMALSNVWGLTWGQLQLRFSDTCMTAATTTTRSLSLDGKFTGVDAATGALEVELSPTSPVLTEPEYDTYVADGTLVDVVRAVSVGLPGSAPWTWRIDQSMIDPAGKSHAAGGTSSSLTQAAGGPPIYDDSFDFRGAKITLRHGASTSTSSSLLSLIDSGAVTQCTFSRAGLAPVTCTLHQIAPIFVKR